MEEKELTQEEIMRFAEFLRRRRTELDLTMEELSLLAFGTKNRSKIGDLEKGLRIPTYKTMLKITKALNCTINFIPNENN